MIDSVFITSTRMIRGIDKPIFITCLLIRATHARNCEIIKNKTKMFKNLVTLVTGGASGIGKATAQRFARKGSRIVLCDSKTSNGAEVVKSLGNDSIFVPADLTNAKDAESLIEATKQKFGRLDILVNCAGIDENGSKTKSAEELDSIDDFQSTFLTSPTITFNVLRSAVGLISENEINGAGERGVIINAVSGHRHSSHDNIGAIAASASVIGMSQPLAQELGLQCIRVMTIVPKSPSAETADSPSSDPALDGFAHATELIVANAYLNGTVIDLNSPA